MIKISEQWLREWVDLSCNTEQLAAQLTMAGLEVDHIAPVAAPFSGVIIAHVVDAQPHPQADRLTVCQVDMGAQPLLQIVCGAKNVRSGLKVALAQVGAQLPELSIKEAKLRGVVSQGMLCSAQELGMKPLSHTDGILELPEDAPIGVCLREWLALDDHVLEIDLTPNRADCLSVYGVAREAAALAAAPLKPWAAAPIQPNSDESIQVQLLAEEACPQYYGRIIQHLNPHAKTPHWLQERLNRAGIRAIHPVVDVTNYVMLEIGQPMHAFDVAHLNGAIQVRMAQEKESLRLLNGQDIHLSSSMLVIADDTQPLALAGIMGGERASVSEDTETVFLESAFFKPECIAGVGRQFGLTTDSAQRYERGVDPAMQLQALERATALLISFAGGQAGPVVCAQAPQYLPQPWQIVFHPERVQQLIGIELAHDDMQQSLQSLGMKVQKEASFWQVIPPSYRFDIRYDVDLIEEIVRLYGYDRLPCTKMVSVAEPVALSAVEQISAQLMSFFTARAYHDTITYSFVDPELNALLYPQSSQLTLLNPISSELAVMRSGLWSGLLASMLHNIHRQQMATKLFELGVIFEQEHGKWLEHPCIGGLIAGEFGGLNWLEPARTFDFYDVKGDLQALFALLKLENIRFETAEHPALHPGQSARIYRGDCPIGWCGVLHPTVLESLDISQNVILFEIKISELVRNNPIRYQAISKFPLIRRDLALVVDKTIRAAQIEEVIRKTAQAEWLKSFDVFDVYVGENIPAGKKSMAVSLTWQDAHRTLQDDEINHAINAIIEKLNQDLLITLRN